MDTMNCGQAFLDESRAFLTTQYFPKILRCLDVLTDEDVWWRPHETSNSIGNLLLHLTGNIRQWIVGGVGRGEVQRDRQGEFDERRRRPKAEIVAALSAALDEVDAVLAELDPACLTERRTIQGRDVTVLHAIYHVVEHFAMHAGQIIQTTKQRTGHDLAFYDIADGVPRARW